MGLRYAVASTGAAAQIIGAGVVDERAGIGGAAQVEQVFTQWPKLRLRIPGTRLRVLASSRDTSVECDVPSASLAPIFARIFLNPRYCPGPGEAAARRDHR